MKTGVANIYFEYTHIQMKKWLAVAFLGLICLPIIYALVKPGFFITHDGEFNLIRLMHFYDELARGQFPVRWAYDLGYRFGSPIFTFFYPLAYYLASVIHFLGPDFGASLKMLIALTTLGSVLAVYYWLRGHFKPWPAFFGAVVFLLVPYRLLVMYVTGSYGILLSLLFLPLILLAIDRKAVILLALSTAGLMMSHNVTALIFLPIVLVYAVRKIEKRTVIGFVLGLGLATTFLLPAIMETKNVFLGQGVVVDFREHFPSLLQLIYSKWGYFYSGTGESDGMSFQVGLAQWLVWGVSTLVLAKKLLGKKIRDEKTGMAILFSVIFSVAILMMLPISTPIWEKIALLAQIQFPWRILAVTSVSVPFLAAYLTSGKYGKILAMAILGLLIWNNRNYLRTWETIRYSDAYYRSHESRYYGSTDIAWETRPIWANDPPVWLANSVTVPNPIVQINKEEVGVKGNIYIEAVATTAANLVINRFYYPIWKTTLDGKGVEVRPIEKSGLIGLNFPSGKHVITIEQGKTGVEKLADGISLLALISLIVWSKKFSSF